MSRVLVVYATGTGCTADVAKRMGETLSGKGMQVDVKPFESSPEPVAYDAIVAGSGTRAGSWHGAAKKWMIHNARVLKEKSLAMFTVGIALADGREKTEEMLGYTARLLAKTGLEPFDIGVFAGWYDPGKFNWLERKIMQVKQAPKGDFRDWEAIESWATSVAPRLTSDA